MFSDGTRLSERVAIVVVKNTEIPFDLPDPEPVARTLRRAYASILPTAEATQVSTRKHTGKRMHAHALVDRVRESSTKCGTELTIPQAARLLGIEQDTCRRLDRDAHRLVVPAGRRWCRRASRTLGARSYERFFSGFAARSAASRTRNPSRVRGSISARSPATASPRLVGPIYATTHVVRPRRSASACSSRQRPSEGTICVAVVKQRHIDFAAAIARTAASSAHDLRSAHDKPARASRGRLVPQSAARSRVRRLLRTAIACVDEKSCRFSSSTDSTSRRCSAPARSAMA